MLRSELGLQEQNPRSHEPWALPAPSKSDRSLFQEMRFRSQIGMYLNDLGLVGVGVEVGVHTGRFAEQILSQWSGRRLWLVDPWQHLSDYLDSFNATDEIMERRYKLARHRLERWRKRVGWIRERSEAAAKRFDQCACDFVYIDANHSYEHVRRDLRLWYPKVRRGGLFSGHDYFDAASDAALEPVFSGQAPPRPLTSYGVKSAVDEFAKSIGVVVRQTLEKYPTWYFVKPEGSARSK